MRLGGVGGSGGGVGFGVDSPLFGFSAPKAPKNLDRFYTFWKNIWVFFEVFHRLKKPSFENFEIFEIFEKRCPNMQ